MARKKTTSLETTPELSFVKSGRLNMIVHKPKERDPVKIETDSSAFLEDARIVRNTNMDQVTFKDCVFKVTLDFLEPMMCLEETAVRESTDWVLCSCAAANSFYSKVEERLVLQQCTVSLLSNVAPLVNPFILVLMLEDGDEWVVERVLP